MNIILETVYDKFAEHVTISTTTVVIVDYEFAWVLLGESKVWVHPVFSVFIGGKSARK